MEQHITDLSTAAKELYDQGLYQKALDQYEEIVSVGVKDTELFYNIGNWLCPVRRIRRSKTLLRACVSF
jgi:Tfp pilus assembly protein PilF